jgi:glycerol-3-phosphate acyltransferase PlsY
VPHPASRYGARGYRLRALDVVPSSLEAHALWVPILSVGLSYLLGGVLGADLVGRWYGFDARTAGSGNPGATNVYRTAGMLPALVVLLWDAGKGWLAVDLPFWMHDERAWPVACVCAIAALLGHVRPPWSRRGTGGKGVATFVGALAGLVPVAAGVFVAVWAAVFASARYVSLASLVAGAAAVVAWGLAAPPPWTALAWTTASVSYAVVLWRHRTNIRRLRTGEEPRTRRLRTHGR